MRASLEQDVSESCVYISDAIFANEASSSSAVVGEMLRVLCSSLGADELWEVLWY